MNLFFIKIGKAWHTLRREGLWRGGIRVLRAFSAMFRRVGSGDVLFVTGGVGDSARYRCHHMAEELALHGLRASVTVQDNPFLARYAKNFSVFVFHRVLFTPRVAELIKHIQAVGKEIIFETDDLVYDPQYLKHMDYFRQMNAWEKKLYENGVGGEILANPYVKVCTTSTEFLAEKLRAFGKDVFVVCNKLSEEDAKFGRAAMKEAHRSARSKSRIRIGYFSGTPSHNKDFATIIKPLSKVLEKYEQCELVLAGPLDTNNTLAVFGDRVQSIPFASRKRHFANIASVDVNLAPLERGNPFCEAKSELKFFEAGLVGVPTIASATDPYVRAISDGEDGFTANGDSEWEEKLSLLVENAMLRRQMGARAHKKTMRKYVTRSIGDEEYLNYVKSKVKANI